MRRLVPALAVFLVVAFAFTRELLGLSRPEFVEEGVAPLRLLAVTTAVYGTLALPAHRDLKRLRTASGPEQ